MTIIITSFSLKIIDEKRYLSERDKELSYNDLKEIILLNCKCEIYLLASKINSNGFIFINGTITIKYNYTWIRVK